jgi:hypothetical protein
MKASSRCFVAVAFLCAAGCKQESPAKPSPPAPTASERPLDRLLPGELAEGKEQAMGLFIPRDMKLERVFDDSALARGRVSAEAVADYIRTRVEAPSAELADRKTIFRSAHPRGAAAGKMLRIEILRDVDTTVLMLRDTTPPQVPTGLSEPERWQKAGVVPGKPFDPKAF